MKVALLTMFNGINSTYSLVNIVAEHLKMLLDAGIETRILVSEDCSDTDRKGIFADERLGWIKVTNRLNNEIIHWKDYSQPDGDLHDTFFDEVNVIAEDFIKKLYDIDVCIMHDIHYQGWHLIHNVAIRKAQEKLPNTRFLAVTHSAPVNRASNLIWPFSARYTPMPNTIYVYPTQSGIPALAKQYHVPEGKCIVVNNSLDIISNMSRQVQSIHKQFNLVDPDILIIYPGRLTTGKRFEKVAAVAGAIRKKSELSVKVLFCDFPSADIEPNTYKEAIKKVGEISGMESKNIAFTSDMGYPQGFVRNGVFELFILSNLFICPSYSESFGLTVLEAASRGNFLILNQAVPALEELGKKLNAYFMRCDARNFGYDTKETYRPSEQGYYEEHATKIVQLMRENPVIHAKTLARQRFSPQCIWYNQLEPLLKMYNL
jgi:glycosyltransferase involved in cell wall biosynthesis